MQYDAAILRDQAHVLPHLGYGTRHVLTANNVRQAVSDGSYIGVVLDNGRCAIYRGDTGSLVLSVPGKVTNCCLLSGIATISMKDGTVRRWRMRSSQPNNVYSRLERLNARR